MNADADRGFEEIEERLDGHERRLLSVEVRLAAIDQLNKLNQNHMGHNNHDPEQDEKHLMKLRILDLVETGVIVGIGLLVWRVFTGNGNGHLPKVNNFEEEMPRATERTRT